MTDTVRIEQITPREDCVEVEYGLLDETGIYVFYTIIVLASAQQYTAVWRQLSLPVVLTHLRITLPCLVIPIQSSIVISIHLLTEGYFIFIVK